MEPYSPPGVKAGGHERGLNRSSIVVKYIMNSRRHSLVGMAIVILVLSASGLSVSSEAATSQSVTDGLVTARIVADVSSVVPGRPFTAALRLRMAPHWHVYWRNPGDAGTPPRIDWALPAGWKVGPIQWPPPEVIMTGPLAGYGYQEEVLLPFIVEPSPMLQPGTEAVLRAGVTWLVCREKCIPGEAELSFTMPVEGRVRPADDSVVAMLSEAVQRLPQSSDRLDVSAEVDDSRIILSFRSGIDDGTLPSISFLPYDQSLIEHAAEQRVELTDDGLRLIIERSSLSTGRVDSVAGLLVIDPHWPGTDSLRAVTFEVPVGISSAQTAGAASTGAGVGLPTALMFAFLGGLILNLMPCVLPVLSLKVIGLVNSAGESLRTRLSHGFLFTLGVLVSFWALVGIMLLLRAGGEQVGWGVQLQSPGFVMVLAGFMFLFGLNMLGVFEIGAGASRFGTMGSRHGRIGPLLNGVTATIVATPCTAPFMGSALGFSLTQSAGVTWLIFTALGFGMAAPYLLLAVWPALLRLVPKPGQWMVTLKQVMGFLLLATVVWLAWVLSIQGGGIVVVTLLGLLLILGFAAWLKGQWGRLHQSAGRRRLVTAIAAILILASASAGVAGIRLIARPQPGTASTGTNGIAWQVYSDELLAELLPNQPVLVDFTAAWCLSCQVNERVAFGDADVRARLEELDVATLKADWTNRDPAITRALARLDRNSVPVYALYRRGNHQPRLLPEILTPGMVLGALNELESPKPPKDTSSEAIEIASQTMENQL